MGGPGILPGSAPPSPWRATHRRGGTGRDVPFPWTGLEFGGEVGIEEAGKGGVKGWMRKWEAVARDGGEEERGAGEGGVEGRFPVPGVRME